MRQLLSRFRSSAEFRDRFQSNFEHGGLFHPTRAPIPLGEEVLLDIRLPVLRDHMLIRGMVAWRRPGRRRTGVRAGVGIEFLPAEADRRDYLLSVTREDHAEPSSAGQRRHKRLPTDLTVDWRVPATDVRQVTALDDIGPGGAFIRTSERPPEGTPVVLEIVPPGARAPLAIEGRVAWAKAKVGTEGLGVEFRCRDAGGKRRLRELIRRIESTVAA